jgi:hypothetical protein
MIAMAQAAGIAIAICSIMKSSLPKPFLPPSPAGGADQLRYPWVELWLTSCWFRSTSSSRLVARAAGRRLGHNRHTEPLGHRVDAAAPHRGLRSGVGGNPVTEQIGDPRRQRRILRPARRGEVGLE